MSLSDPPIFLSSPTFSRSAGTPAGGAPGAGGPQAPTVPTSAVGAAGRQLQTPESLDEFLLEYLGPKHLPLSSLVPITLVYSLIFVTGLIGNFSTCIVIAKAHYMRTSTNYYLFNLAIADMLTLIFGKRTRLP